MTLADYLSKLPWPVIGALCSLALALGAAVVLLVKLYVESSDARDRSHVRLTNQSWLSREDDGEVEEIPLYPPPPVHVTRFGMHHAHVLAGKETEKGCPVCYQWKLHLRKRGA